MNTKWATVALVLVLWSPVGGPCPVHGAATDLRTLDQFTADLFGSAQAAEKTGALHSATLTVDTVGELAGRQIVELMYHGAGELCETGKAILYEAGPDLYALAYFYIAKCGAIMLQPAVISRVREVEILYTRSPYPEPGRYFEEMYFIWNHVTQEPVSLNHLRVTRESLKRELPEGHYVSCGDCFDIHTLTYRGIAHAPGDIHGFPTGGRVTISYRIADTLLEVAGFSYEPDAPGTWNSRSLIDFLRILFQPGIDSATGQLLYGCHPDSGATTVDTVGQLADRLVVEVAHDCPGDEWCDRGKAILYESDPGHFNILYHFTHDCGVILLEPARITRIDETDILYSRCPLSGTGAHVKEAYWVWDESGDEPLVLDLQGVTEKALASRLPADYSMKWGGRFDIQALSLKGPVHRPEDAHCCPTGGDVRLRYVLDGTVLRVESIEYTPPEPERGIR